MIPAQAVHIFVCLVEKMVDLCQHTAAPTLKKRKTNHGFSGTVSLESALPLVILLECITKPIRLSPGQTSAFEKGVTTLKEVFITPSLHKLKDRKAVDLESWISHRIVPALRLQYQLMLCSDFYWESLTTTKEITKLVDRTDKLSQFPELLRLRVRSSLYFN